MCFCCLFCVNVCVWDMLCFLGGRTRCVWLGGVAAEETTRLGPASPHTSASSSSHLFPLTPPLGGRAGGARCRGRAAGGSAGRPSGSQRAAPPHGPGAGLPPSAASPQPPQPAAPTVPSPPPPNHHRAARQPMGALLPGRRLI